MAKKISILGSTGSIGLTTLKIINKKKSYFTVNLLSANKNFKLICDVIIKVSLMKKLIKQHDLIIPLAALVGAPLCEKFKKDAVSTNLGTIKTLCEIVTKKNKVIYLTTNSGYGIGDKDTFCDEESPLNPISLYGRTKCDGEDLVRNKIKKSDTDEER